MTKFLDIFSDIRKALFFSAFLHLILFVIFFVLKVGINFNSAEFAEVSFISGTRGYRVISRPEKKETRQPEPAPSAATTTVTQQTRPQSVPVNVPKRRMLEDDEPQLSQREPGKLTPEMEASKLPVNEEIYRPEPSVPKASTETIGTRQTVEPGNVDSDLKESAPAGNIGTPGPSQPFTIEGDAAKRTIINQVIPKYPPGLQREAVVRIRFTVLPDGSIGAMIPVQKGDPVLEELTMKALRQWRFNPLLPSAEQKNVQGIITFRFKLK